MTLNLPYSKRILRHNRTINNQLISVSRDRKEAKEARERVHLKKTTSKLFDRFMNRRLELWNEKDITTTLIAPGTVGTAVGRGV